MHLCMTVCDRVCRLFPRVSGTARFLFLSVFGVAEVVKQ